MSPDFSAEFMAAADRAPRWDSDPGSIGPDQAHAGDHDPSADGRSRRPFSIVARGDITTWVNTEPAPVPFVIADFVERGAIALLAGEGGAGKSYTALSAGMSVAADVPFYGKEVIPGRAVCLFCEDSPGAIHARLARLCRAFNVPMESLVGRLFPLSLLDDPIADRTFWRDHKPTARLDVLEQELSAISDIRLLVIDCVTSVFIGDEINRLEVGGFLAALTGMARRLNIGVILIHHASKSQDGSSLRMASGSTAWIAQCRAAAELRKATAEVAPRFAVRKINNGREWDVELEWTDGVLMPAQPPDSFDRRFTARRMDKVIFEKVEAAWDAGNPLSAQIQAKARYLPSILSESKEFTKKALETGMLQWMRSGHLVEESKSARSPRGLKVAKHPEYHYNEK